MADEKRTPRAIGQAASAGAKVLPFAAPSLHAHGAHAEGAVDAADPGADAVPLPADARSRSELALGRQLAAMSALLLFNEGVAGDRPYDELLERLTAQLPAILESRLVALLVADPDGGGVSLYSCERATARTERHVLQAVPLDRLHAGGDTEAWVELLDRLPANVRAQIARAPATRLRVTPVGSRDRLLGLLIACGTSPGAARSGTAWHQAVARNVATATLRVRRNRELVRRAYFDPLTGLPNRTLFNDRLQQGIARARRTARKLAVLYLDLDEFKWVNDTLGHHGGDELLKRVAGLLQATLRETDTVARLAGDEFAIVLPDVGDARQIDKVLATLRARLQSPVEIGGREFELRASIGIAVFPVHGTDADGLLRSADAAMYRVKRARAARRAAEQAATQAARRAEPVLDEPRARDAGPRTGGSEVHDSHGGH